MLRSFALILFKSAVQMHEFHVFMISDCNIYRQISTPAGEEDEETRLDIKNPILKVRDTSHHCGIGNLA